MLNHAKFITFFLAMALIYPVVMVGTVLSVMNGTPLELVVAVIVVTNAVAVIVKRHVMSLKYGRTQTKTVL